MIGKGNTAEVFVCEEGRVCKLFYEGYPREYIELEYSNAKEVFSLGVNSPQPFEIVEKGSRTGIIYERAEGRELTAVMQENMEKIDCLMSQFVQLHRDIIGQKAKNVPAYKDFLSATVRRMAEDSELLEKISMLPDGDCLLHGDYHPGNVLVKADGTFAAIDFMNVCRGPAQFDIARSFVILSEVSRPLAESYLDKMGVCKDELKSFTEVIKACRKYEGA